MPTYTGISGGLAILKELYSGYCPENATEEMTDTHKFRSINDYWYENPLEAEFCEGRKGSDLGNVVYSKNPLLSLIQKDTPYMGAYLPIPLEIKNE